MESRLTSETRETRSTLSAMTATLPPVFPEPLHALPRAGETYCVAGYRGTGAFVVEASNGIRSTNRVAVGRRPMAYDVGRATGDSRAVGAAC